MRSLAPFLSLLLVSKAYALGNDECHVCGDGVDMAFPTGHVYSPSQFVWVKCEDLSTAGTSGMYDDEACQDAQNMAAPCCNEDYVTLENDVTPVWPNFPHCNVCTKGLTILNPDTEVTVLDQTTTCADLFFAGENGFIDDAECPSVAPIATDFCCVQTESPSASPSMTPTSLPSAAPSSSPTEEPSRSPSLAPSASPSSTPSSMPSSSPSDVPSSTPSVEPSVEPSSTPSSKPSTSPSDVPSLVPSSSPSSVPSLTPSTHPSSGPSGTPSLMPTGTPSAEPSVVPTSIPSAGPSSTPSDVPSTLPTMMPSTTPSSSPSDGPSTAPSSVPSDMPSVLPSLTPTATPSLSPSDVPSATPSSIPSDMPSVLPSLLPSATPSLSPSDVPTSGPSTFPSDHPSLLPSDEPSSLPSLMPSLTIFPTSVPSKVPSWSSIPSGTPSAVPSLSLMPSSLPSLTPSSVPSARPSTSSLPSIMPSDIPTASAIPSSTPSIAPSASSFPSGEPSDNPSATPSVMHSELPSVYPSNVPSGIPSSEPSDLPSAIPSDLPSGGPSGEPSGTPSGWPSSVPSDMPSLTHSELPSVLPSGKPSVIPSGVPSSMPSDLPSGGPSGIPSSVPSDSPSDIPSFLPSILPTTSSSPSAKPSLRPSSSSIPSATPSVSPSDSPSPTSFPIPLAPPINQDTSAPSLAPVASPIAPDVPDFCFEVDKDQCTLCKPFQSPDYCPVDESFALLVQARKDAYRDADFDLEDYWFPYLDDKVGAYIFNAGLDIATPDIYCCLTDAVDLQDCIDNDVPSGAPGYVIKVTHFHTNQGVYVLKNDPPNVNPLEVLRGEHLALADIIADLSLMGGTKIIVEELIGDGELDAEYKLHAFPGEVVSIDVIDRRNVDDTCDCIAVVDPEWNRLDQYGCFVPSGSEVVSEDGSCSAIDFTEGSMHPGPVKNGLNLCPSDIPRPEECIINDMINIAESLSLEIGVYMRIDMFVHNGKVYVQEFSPNPINGIRHCVARKEGECIDSCILGRKWKESGLPFGGMATTVPDLLEDYSDKSAEDQCALATSISSDSSFTSSCLAR